MENHLLPSGKSGIYLLLSSGSRNDNEKQRQQGGQKTMCRLYAGEPDYGGRENGEGYSRPCHLYGERVGRAADCEHDVVIRTIERENSVRKGKQEDDN